jgi:hypothetical protein
MNPQDIKMETITLQDIYPPQLLTAAEETRTQAEQALAAAEAAKSTALFENSTQVAKLQADIRKAQGVIPSLKECIKTRSKAGLDPSLDKSQLDHEEARIAQLTTELKLKTEERPALEQEADGRIREAAEGLRRAADTEKTLRTKMGKVAADLEVQQHAAMGGVGPVEKFASLQEVVRKFCTIGFSAAEDGAVHQARIEGVLSLGIKGIRVPSLLPGELKWLAAFPSYAALPSHPERANLLVSGIVSEKEFSDRFADAQQPEHPKGLNTHLRCYVEETRSFLATHRARQVWIPKKQGDTFGLGGEHQDYSDLLGSLSEALAPHVKEAQAYAPFDMESAEPMPMLCALIVEAWREASTRLPTQPVFSAGQARLSQAQIGALIGCYWDAFVDAPWEDSIGGSYALLKHRCARGERPNIFAFQTQGHFGFRIRTPDHDWIKGEIYCPPEHFAPATAPDPLKVINNVTGHDWLSELGPVKFLIKSRTVSW